MIATIKFGNAEVKLTQKQMLELFFNTQVMVDWHVGGRYGDGGEITDKTGLSAAKAVVKKLTKLINTARD